MRDRRIDRDDGAQMLMLGAVLLTIGIVALGGLAGRLATTAERLGDETGDPAIPGARALRDGLAAIVIATADAAVNRTAGGVDHRASIDASTTYLEALHRQAGLRVMIDDAACAAAPSGVNITVPYRIASTGTSIEGVFHTSMDPGACS